MEGKEPMLTREELLRERKKIIMNLVLLVSAAFVVLLALGTMAWFVKNQKVSGEGLHISLKVPEGIQISLGKTGVVTDGTVTDYFMNTADDLLRTEMVNGVMTVTAPRNNTEDDKYDWAEMINIENYYSFGRMIPASSISGEHILFTPESIQTGKELKAGASFYLADGKTDGDLKGYKGKLGENETDPDALMATVHPYKSGENKTAAFWSGYRSQTAWYDTNDDGYYIDIPMWFRTNCITTISLGVEGYVTQKDGSLVNAQEGESEPDALYKAVRVAILVKNDEDAYVPAVATKGDFERNIIPLQNATAFGRTDASIVDSENYTISRDSRDERADEALYGIKMSDALEQGIKQTENYVEYHAYGPDTASNGQGENGGTAIAPAVFVIGPFDESTASESTHWSEAKEMLLRIWLDGDDKDCWNATAGQDWCICLKFAELKSN